MHTFVQYLIWFFVRTLLKTYRYEFVGKENLELAQDRARHGSYLLGIWHEHAMALLSAHAWTVPYLVMASRSKDGDYAAFVARKVGYIPVRGSSRKRNVDKGGKEALQEYVARLKEGIHGGLTIDGPKGPRRVCKPGIAIMARDSGAAIVPLTARAKSCWEFNSWDRFKIPKPFTRITIIYGEPILVSESASPEAIDGVCRLIEARLTTLESVGAGALEKL